MKMIVWQIVAPEDMEAITQIIYQVERADPAFVLLDIN
jgi:hypothetical protein